MTIANIVDAVYSPYAEWRTLGGIVPEMQNGNRYYVAGNAAVSFRVVWRGQRMMLKCYTRPNRRLGAIYGEGFRPREIVVVDVVGRSRRIDCLIMPYIEGRTLDEAIVQAATESEYRALAEGFDRLAREILADERAHGDLKPENVIVCEDGTMRAVDWDAAFLPRFAGEQAVETGTAAYQHPARTVEMYDKHIDDYSIAMISTLLHAAAIDPATMAHYRLHHEPPFMPRDIVAGRAPLLEQIVESFARRGMARQYRVAEMLRRPYATCSRLHDILLRERATVLEGEPLLDVDWGWWGCRCDEGWTIEPLYDSGFEPEEGVALMTLGGYSHLVRVGDGAVRVSFDRGLRVGPLRDGAVVVRGKDGAERRIEVGELIFSTKKSIFVK